MSDSMQQILLMIRTQTGHDFSRYKPSTVRRRIERLMAVNQIETIADYARHLQNNTIGVEVLFRDLLIGVTNFFRDKEVFESLLVNVIPKLFENQSPDEPIRIWVPGCSTGEEAYSIAILLREYMKTLRREYRVQIFATDIDSQAVNAARVGAYASNIEMDVPEQYLKQYFLPLPDGGYQVVKSLREMLVFAPHSVIKDPPFSKLHLISCRNLLIYLNAELQDQVLSYFHFALVPMGFLMLGSSESLGQHEDEFAVVESQHKIFQRIHGVAKARFKSDIPFMLPSISKESVKHPPPIISLREITESTLLNEWTPACVLINNQGHMRYVHGSTEKYLVIYPGEMDQLDIVRSARESLRIPLKAAIYRAVTQQREIFEPNITVEVDDRRHIINLIVKPLAETFGTESLLAVFFEEVKSAQTDKSAAEENDENAEDQHEHRQLQQELNDTRAYLQATIEELKSSNEEMQSINEELQSVNEELETSQEELKAVNEELLTINAELEEKVEEVTWANDDLSNTLNALQTGIILLDSDFNIRRFNPAATQVFKLIPGDVGRSITHIVSEFDYPTLFEDTERVFNTLVPHEVDVQAKQGRWYALQIRPYRTLQNAIKGVVIYFIDVTSRK